MLARSKSAIRTKNEICSQLAMKTPERPVFILNLKQFSQLFLSVVNFEQVILCWEFPFNLAIAKIYVPLGFADDGTRTGGI